MIAIEVSAAIDNIGTVKTFYLSNAQLVTLPTDSPANVAFDPVLTNFSVSTAVFADSQTTGNSSKTQGEIVIANDGSYDDWLDYGFDGRSVVIKSGQGAYPSGFASIFTGQIENVDVTFSSVVITLRDMQGMFNTPVLTNYYLGNNSLPNGLEGQSDLKGKPKPKVFGSVYNIEPTLVNTSKLTYQVSDGSVASILVRDKGVVLNNGGDFATSAALQNATGLVGYGTCLAEGYFRLAATPAGKVTVDVVQGANAVDRTVATILQTLAQLAGLPLGKIKTAEFAALRSVNPAVIGIAINDDTTFSEAMDSVAQSIGAYYAFDPNGNLGTGILTAPSGTPAFQFADYDIQSGLNRRSAKDNNLPVYTVALNYKKNYAPAGNDLAGSVGAQQSLALSSAVLTERASDTSVKLKYLKADELTVDTLLMSQADAAAEVARLLTIYKVRRDIFEVPMHFDSLPVSPLYLMALVSLLYDRFGLSSGRTFRLLGIAYDLRAKRATLTLWG